MWWSTATQKLLLVSALFNTDEEGSSSSLDGDLTPPPLAELMMSLLKETLLEAIYFIGPHLSNNANQQNPFSIAL